MDMCAEHVCHKTHGGLVISLHARSVRRGYIWENLQIFIIYDECEDPSYSWISGSKYSAAIFGS